MNERGSTLITSNLPLDEWTKTFDTERLTGALLDRLTHHVRILEMNADSYRLAPPSERMMHVEGVATPRKVDVRLYAYAGRVILTAARIYQGQATNFRTPGGGFAPVFVV